MSKLLITSDVVLPISSPPARDSAVFIENGLIKDIGPSHKLKKKYEGAEALELGDGILMPGFINAHVHLELGWIKEKIGVFNGFTEWLKQIIGAKHEPIAEETLERSVRDGIEELKASGVTTVGEISSYGGLDKPILKDSGLRTVLFREVVDSKEETTDFSHFEKSELFEERLFPHAPYSCAPRLLEKSIKSHKKTKTPIGIHLAESPHEMDFVRGKVNSFESTIFPIINKDPFSRHKADTPFSYLEELGFFDRPGVTTIHMVHVGPDEVERIRDKEVGIVLCPRSNLYLQVGIPPLDLYRDLERLGLGTDGLSSNYNLDFFEELRSLHLLMSLTLGEQAAKKAVYCGTLGGAKSLYIEDRTGSLEIEKEADLIFLNSKGHSADPYLSVISATTDNLDMLMVRGKVLHLRK